MVKRETPGVQIYVDSKEAPRTKDLSRMTLNAEVKNLPEGDFLLIGPDGSTTAVERKTWNDAYSSWQSKRLPEQISRLVENTDMSVLLIEGECSLTWFGKDQVLGLKNFLNRMSLEICPVVYTDTLEQTMRFIRSHALRMEDGTVNQLIRPVTVVTTTSSRHHAFLEQIPKVGKQTAKKIHEKFDSVQDFVDNWDQALAEGIVKGVAWQSVADFIAEKWISTDQREVLFTKGKQAKL